MSQGATGLPRPLQVISILHLTNIQGAYNYTPLQEEKFEEGGWVIEETFIGASISAFTGEDPAPTTVSYFKGNDPAKWKTALPTYNTVSLGEIYPGIELKLKAYGNNMEKLFHVNPGADPRLIKVGLEGVGRPGLARYFRHYNTEWLHESL